MCPQSFVRALILVLVTLSAACDDHEEQAPSPGKPSGIDNLETPLPGNLGTATAHWLSADTLVWNRPASGHTFALHFDAEAGLRLTSDEVAGGHKVALKVDSDGLPDSLQARFPHLNAMTVLRIAADDLPRMGRALRGQLVVSATDGQRQLVDASGVQIPGVLDDLFSFQGRLGPYYADQAITLSLWAPTAQNVNLLLFDGSATPTSSVIPMTFNEATGVWSATGDLGWDRQYYLFEVSVFAPTTGRIETNRVTDPYSLSLSTDSRRSQLVDLNDPELAPDNWSGLNKPSLQAAEDSILYELHVRDFSSADANLAERLRGTFAAFGARQSRGAQHLKQLAQAGISHIHLLPSFDIATIPELASERSSVDRQRLAGYPSDSDRQQAAVAAIKDVDGFNWGYDPYHYTVPEGSYSTDPDGPIRIIEFRTMVSALNQAGLRVVMDVVYNHTHAAGQDPKSVLDRIVPGYYHRLNARGDVETSTCCANTATEHAMMEKLMIDSVLTWARHYKIDGFRFDLMGHHSKASMLRLRAALNALTVDKDGVDGQSIYLYGEGWNFGEVADDARFVQATQQNMGGTGIGTFSDRLRDGVRGGTPFGDLREQGFVNGLGFDPNEFESASGDGLTELLAVTDWIRVGLAADTADFELTNASGNVVRADQIDYLGQPAGYTADPQENIKYVAAHDNETLFDANQVKLPVTTPMADRVRVQNLSNAIVMLGQGIPFFHAGQEFLRSKSMDRDSFNSGDWFNAIDWSLATSNWGKGLPVAEKNQDKWPLMAPLLANTDLAPDQSAMQRSFSHFKALAKVRQTTPLLRLRTAEAIRNGVRFHNTGPDQTPGLIAMTIQDGDQWVLNLFNARPQVVAFELPALAGVKMELHEALQQLFDADEAFYPPVDKQLSNGQFTIPPRTGLTYLSGNH